MAKQKRYNDRPILLTEGEIYIDGVKIYDGVDCKINAHFDTWTGKTIGSRGKRSSRTKNVTYDGTIKRRRKTPWARKILQEYLNSGKTPEFTIQGIQSDKNSDYYDANGSETVTAVGCVLTGDLTLLNLEAEGDVLDDELNFNAFDVNFS